MKKEIGIIKQSNNDLKASNSELREDVAFLMDQNAKLMDQMEQLSNMKSSRTSDLNPHSKGTSLLDLQSRKTLIERVFVMSELKNLLLS